MTGKVFVDTNILIYAHDVDSGEKHAKAKQTLRELWEDGNGVVSPQVLQEFYVNVTRKLRSPLSKIDARALVDTYSAWCVDTTASDVARAFDIEDSAKLGFWDALIMASAIKARAVAVLSEDLNSGQTVETVRIENPFAVK